MPYLDWEDRYSIGIESMDGQHKKLLALINEVYDAMKAGKGKEKSGVVLRELLEYTESHFASEEEFLRQHGYPQIQAHIEKHRSMTRRVLEYKGEYERGSVTIAFELLKFLKGWLVKHIMETDRHYADYILSL
jgi:hemerythrin-like metal-binding protein